MVFVFKCYLTKYTGAPDFSPGIHGLITNVLSIWFQVEFTVLT